MQINKYKIWIEYLLLRYISKFLYYKNITIKKNLIAIVTNSIIIIYFSGLYIFKVLNFFSQLRINIHSRYKYFNNHNLLFGKKIMYLKIIKTLKNVTFLLSLGQFSNWIQQIQYYFKILYFSNMSINLYKLQV